MIGVAGLNDAGGRGERPGTICQLRCPSSHGGTDGWCASTFRSLAGRTLSVLLLALLLVGCGFQLRGVGATADIEPLYLATIRETRIFDALRRNLEVSGVDVLDAPDPGHWRLVLLDEQEEERVVSVTERGLAADFELTLELRYQLEDADGELLIPPETATVSRVYRQDPDNLAGSSRERELLRREMDLELAQQIIRRVNAAQRRANAAGSGTGGAGVAAPPGT